MKKDNEALKEIGKGFINLVGRGLTPKKNFNFFLSFSLKKRVSGTETGLFLTFSYAIFFSILTRTLLC